MWEKDNNINCVQKIKHYNSYTFFFRISIHIHICISTVGKSHSSLAYVMFIRINSTDNYELMFLSILYASKFRIWSIKKYFHINETTLSLYSFQSQNIYTEYNRSSAIEIILYSLSEFSPSSNCDVWRKGTYWTTLVQTLLLRFG